jgi:hypothetical protein
MCCVFLFRSNHEKSFLTSALVGFACFLSLGFLAIERASALDLTAGGSGETNGGLAKFTTVDNAGSPPAGSGVIDAFLRIRNNGSEEGFNTNFRSSGQPPLDGVAGDFTRNLALGDVPVVNGFRRFFLDLNESGGSNARIDLTELKIFLSPTASLGTLVGLTPIFTLDQTVNLRDVNSGSGRYDLFVDIADSLFTGGTTQNLYLFSKFSNADAGFEEWSVGTPNNPTPVPTPALLPGLIGMGIAALRNKKKLQGEVAQDA